MSALYDKMKELKDSLTEDQIITLMRRFGATQFHDTGKALQFPTVCHHEDEGDGSFKLWYYKDTHLFRCFSECSATFDIFRLAKKRMEMEGEDTHLENLYYLVLNHSGIDFDTNLVEVSRHKAIAKDYEMQPLRIELPSYPPHLLELYTWNPIAEWLADGISEKAMFKYKILYSIGQEQIVIPHWDFDGRLIGIRGRNLNEEKAEYIGKYMPVKVEGKSLAHPLGLNLYGLNLIKNRINKYGLAIVAEGEKSVLQSETMFGKYSTTVACCGSVINRWQVLQLIEAGATEICLAFDNEELPGADKYYRKLFAMCEKYKHYCNFSFIYDTEKIPLKQSPFDLKDPNTFIELLQRRIKIK